MHTSSSSLFARLFSPSDSCFCSAARALDKSTSSSFDRMTHSKCRSRSSYCRKTSFSRPRTLRTPYSLRNKNQIKRRTQNQKYSQSNGVPFTYVSSDVIENTLGLTCRDRQSNVSSGFVVEAQHVPPISTSYHTLLMRQVDCLPIPQSFHHHPPLGPSSRQQ